jgi:hypothetical protein
MRAPFKFAENGQCRVFGGNIGYFRSTNIILLKRISNLHAKMSKMSGFLSRRELHGVEGLSDPRTILLMVLGSFTGRLSTAALLVIGISAGACNKPKLEMTTPYQAVLLTNGSAYFGKLEGLGTPFPILREVFYVQSVQDPESKKVSNTLVKRGKEWHSPDRMILNANMIVLVEPVNPSSRVAQLIAEAKNQ